MNIQAVYHRPESNYCYATDAKTIKLRIRFAKDEKIDNLRVLYNTKYHIASEQLEKPLSKIACDGVFDYYGVTLDLKDPRLAYVFYFEINDEPFYFCEDGIVTEYNFDLAYFNSFQVAYVNESDVIENVKWLDNAVFYQIFVDRFCKSNKVSSFTNTAWSDLPTPKSFYGGDLYGIADNIDYIKDLGATAIYLTPIFVSKSNHKYDTIDYFNVDPSFGGNDALEYLVEKAREKNIKIVLDAVFNHVSQEFAPFADVKKNGKESKYFDWFVIDGDTVGDNNENVACFAECEYMPKLNACNEKVCEYLLNVATYWIKKYDIDGWRLDVSDEVSHDFWRRMRRAVKSIKPSCVLIGENWHNSESFLSGDQFDCIMNYAVTKRMIDFWATESVDADTLAEKMSGLYMRYNDVTNGMMYNLLDSHDTARFLTLVGNDESRLLSAIATLVFLPGSFNLYYGTEILSEGNSDPDCRRAFDFEKLKNPKVRSFVAELKKVLAIKNMPAIKSGDVKFYSENGNFVIERSCNEQTLKLSILRGQKGLGNSTFIGYNINNDGSAVPFIVKGEII